MVLAQIIEGMNVTIAGSRRTALFKVFFLIIIASMIGIACEDVLASDGEGEEVQSSVPHAAMAYKLAALGQETESPILMLAAIELMGPLKQTDAQVTLPPEGGMQKSTKQKISFEPHKWSELAAEYCKENAAQKSLVEEWTESQSTRRLMQYPRGSFSDMIGNIPYMVVDTGMMSSGQVATYQNVGIRAGHVATIGVIGSSQGNFSLTVTDGQTVKNVSSFNGIALVTWTPTRNHLVSIKVVNNGPACQLALISD